MANKMLIEAAHREETRVVVVRGNRVEEFDFESQSRKQLRGNIYLAKVTRVEPSLQAAFIEYGGNRHGFLAFAEIHPDYYQIPVADREALLAEDARAARDEEDEENGRSRRRRRRRPTKPKAKAAGAETDETVSGEAETEGDAAEAAGDEGDDAASDADGADDNGGDENGEAHEEDQVESVGAGDAYEDMPERSFRMRRQYKIQEVIKRRQVMLVQVVKEERGSKGAALTTYLSLAGRYSVLMPNTARGGGISRKITNAADRKRLKSIAGDLEVPDGMGVILRTAGANRTKTEVKRDFEYLLRLWETVRETTLKSNAPTLVYEEGSLIKRAIRDLYNKDIEEVMVAGDDGYREAKDFMRMLMPSHAKNVKPYREAAPIFARFGVESQLDAMFSNTVQLKSGGYIVINQTEALVAIDVNSGRATREHNIEDTALKTNLEAADEVARQLRLRDLAGLIVVDFIDMDEKRNNRAVEKRMKDALKNDRARIQVGRISHFGLLEMSRQRIRTGVLESSTEVCPTCGGTGHVRSVSSVSLHLLRSLEDQLLKSSMYDMVVRTRAEVALYVLNHKRAHLHELEQRFRVSVDVRADATVTGQHMFQIERGAQVHTPETAYKPPSPTSLPPEPDEADIVETEVEAEVEESVEETRPARGPRRPERIEGERDDGEGAEGADRKRRRRRRRRRGRGPDGREFGPETGGAPRENGDDEGEDEADEGAPEMVGRQAPIDADAGETGPAEAGEATPRAAAEPEDENGDRRRRRRGRRGGRRDRPESAGAEAGSPDETAAEVAEATDEPMPQGVEPETEPTPAPPVAAPAPVVVSPPPAPEPIKRRRTPDPEPIDDVAPAADAPRRSGWWGRK